MNINYEAEARRKQQEQEQQKYQAQRDPFKYGQDVARRRYSEIMSGLQERQQQTSKSYSDLYQQAREMAVAQRAAGAPSLSGGMKAQYSDLVSAREMQQLGQIGGAREQALRDIELQKQSAFANAQLEGQQAEQTLQQSQLNKLALGQQKQAIRNNKDLSAEEKAQQLQALGVEVTAEELDPAKKAPGVFEQIVSSLGIGAGAGVTAGLATKGLGLIFPKLAAAAGPVGWTIGIIVAVAYGAEKIAESIQGKGAEGGLIGTEGVLKTGFNI